MSQYKTWKQRLDEAKERNGFTQEDGGLAHTFEFCPVGEKLHLKGTDIEARLQAVGDAKLYDAGYHFLWAVQRNDINKAELIYQEIQKA